MRLMLFIWLLCLLGCESNNDKINLTNVMLEFIEDQDMWVEVSDNKVFLIDSQFVEINDHYQELILREISPALKNKVQKKFDQSLNNKDKFLIEESKKLKFKPTSGEKVVGIFSLSPPVFFDEDKGLLFISYSCKGDCGFTVVVLFEKKNQEYHYSSSTFLTIS